MTDTRETLKQILGELYPGLDAANGQDLVRTGVLDSFGMVSLIAQIRAVFDVKVPPDKILPEHFQNLDAMCALVDSLRRKP